MEKKPDLSELKKMVEKNSAQLTPDDLENVIGGVDFTPAQVEFAKAVIQAYKNIGYTREQFVEELNNSGANGDYAALYLELWDSM